MCLHTLIVVIFIVMVSYYIITVKVDVVEKWIIFFSLLVLLFSTLNPRKNSVEGFANDSLALKSEVVTLQDILGTHKRIDLEENPEDISAGLVMYTTAFSSKSYPNYGKTWINIAPKPKDAKKDCPPGENSLQYELNPIYSRRTGFYLGNNRLVGPYSNSLNIQFHNTFSVIMVVKHSNLVVNQSNSEIEFIKMYANSPNNNGMSLYIKQNSLTLDNNVQMGNLLFQYADQAPRQCLMNKEDNLMHLDKDLLVFYYIIKDIDNIRILYMTEKSNNIHQLLKFNVSNEDITFSNKEMVINRLLSWNANIFNFALYSMALSDDEVTSFYNHIMGEYIKNMDPSFGKILSKYNITIDFLENFTKCPYDKTTCDSCTTVNSWCDTSQVMAASSTCKKAIDTFCTTNPKNPACKCWDNTSTVYNTESCKLYRSIFGTKENFLNFLSVEDLEAIKKKYNLLSVDECPKEINQKPGFAKNTYTEYDYNKLKVNMEAEAYKRLYPQKEKCDTPDLLSPSPNDLDNALIKKPSGDLKTTTNNSVNDSLDYVEYKKKLAEMSIPPKETTATTLVRDEALEQTLLKKPKAEIDPKQTLSDLYLKDPNLNTDPDESIASKQYKEIQEMARRDQNKHLRIGQVQRPETSKEAQELPALQRKTFGIGSERSDSFFNKFIKIMVPSKEEA